MKDSGKYWFKNNKLYVKANWRWRAKKVMFKMDGLADRWTQVIKSKWLVGGLIPFYLVPLIELHEAGEDIIKCIITKGKDVEEFIVTIDDVLDSRRQTGRGSLTQILFDRDYKHLTIPKIKENK